MIIILKVFDFWFPSYISIILSGGQPAALDVYVDILKLINARRHWKLGIEMGPL